MLSIGDNACGIQATTSFTLGLTKNIIPNQYKMRIRYRCDAVPVDGIQSPATDTALHILLYRQLMSILFTSRCHCQYHRSQVCYKDCMKMSCSRIAYWHKTFQNCTNFFNKSLYLQIEYIIISISIKYLSLYCNI